MRSPVSVVDSVRHFYANVNGFYKSHDFRSADVLSGRHFVRTGLDVLSGRHFFRTALDVLSGRRFVRTGLDVLSGPICATFFSGGPVWTFRQENVLLELPYRLSPLVTSVYGVVE